MKSFIHLLFTISDWKMQTNIQFILLKFNYTALWILNQEDSFHCPNIIQLLLKKIQ